MIFISILVLLVAIALPSLKSEISSLIIIRISAIIFIFSGALALNAFYIQSIGSGIGIYSGLFHVTIISQLLDVFLFILAGLILISWPLITSSNINKVLALVSLLTDGSSSNPKLVPLGYNKGHQYTIIGLYTPRTEYCLIVLFSALGSSLLISSADLVSMYLSLELQSFGLYILATIYRDYESSTSAGLKYFILGGLSSCLILLGAGLIYSYTGLTNFESIYSLMSVAMLANDTTQDIISGVSLGLIFMFIGLLFKIAAAPLHSWSPDVYDETPTQVTIWLTIIPKIAILVLLLELISGLSIKAIINLNMNTIDNTLQISNIWSNLYYISFNTMFILKMLLLICSLLSLIMGTLVGLAQTRIKRLLTYSTISHIGFILLALAINTEQSIEAFIFYIIQYSITNLNIFFIIIALGFIIHKDGIKFNYNTNTNTNTIFLFDYDIRFLATFQGHIKSNPILSFSLIICLFSMAGIPPLLGFFSKQFVLLSAVQSGYWFMAFIAIISSVISASYYLRLVVLLVTGSYKDTNLSFKNNNVSSDNSSIITGDILGQQKNESILTNFHSFLISTITLSILLFILKPSIILNSTQLLSLSLFFY